MNLKGKFVQQDEEGPPHVIIKARAGTGKTTTLIEGLKRLKGMPTEFTPSPQQAAVWESMSLSADATSVCFCAFNKSIATELKSRVPTGCEASTNHAMGFRAVANSFTLLKDAVEGNRVLNIIAEITGTNVRILLIDQLEMVKGVERLVSLCKMNCTGPVNFDDAVDWEDQLDQLASHYEIELNGKRRRIFELVPKVLRRCADVVKDQVVDFDDMIWLPVALGLTVPRYDLLLVDEAQDLNRCQQALAKKASKRLILCGDERQAIYGFAGADADSLPRMGRELDATLRGCITLPLTVTRRCGKAIVREAQTIVPDIEAFPENGEGQISRRRFKLPKEGEAGPKLECYDAFVQDGDMCVCRVNAPLVSQCFRFIRKGRKATIQGRDVGKGLITTIQRLERKSKVIPYTIVALVSDLSDWCFSEREKEQAKRIPSDNRMIAIQDKHDCLMCFVDGVKTVQEVIGKIETMFVDDKKSPGIRFSSIHKAKGMEARRVFLLEPEGASVPHPMARSKWQIEQEWNLRYVAITRAIEELVYVS